MIDAIEALQRSIEDEGIHSSPEIENYDNDDMTEVLHRSASVDEAGEISTETNNASSTRAAFPTRQSDFPTKLSTTEAQAPLYLSSCSMKHPIHHAAWRKALWRPHSPSPPPINHSDSRLLNQTMRQVSHIPIITQIQTAGHGWAVEYSCYECERPVKIRGGVFHASTGSSTEQMRCQACGCRILYKKRTNRTVQFEAR